MGAISQLRIYTITRGLMNKWIKGWSEGVYPLRLKQGFSIDGAWVIEEENSPTHPLRHGTTEWAALPELGFQHRMGEEDVSGGFLQ